MTQKKEAVLRGLWMRKREAMSDMIRGRYTYKERQVICQGTRRRLFFLNRRLDEVLIYGMRNPCKDDPDDSVIFRVGKYKDFTLCVDLRTLEPIFIDRDLLGKELVEDIDYLISTLKKMRSDYNGHGKAS